MSITYKQIEDISCWIITEGMAGTENQCLGITDALDIKPIIKHVALRFPWKQLTPYFRIGHKWSFSKVSDSFLAPYPDLVIASGRKSILAAIHIKKASKNKTLIVQIQDPRINPKFFDLVVIPQHDPTRGDNVITTTGALHKVTTSKLKKEVKKFPNLIKLQTPRIAVLIGGNSKTHTITPERTKQIAQQLKKLSKQYSLMITVSRRTPEHCINIFKNKLNNIPNIFFWNGNGDNPYFAFLALADYILVTEDSVSMTSEALSTGKPIYTITLDGNSTRIDKFHALLQKQKYTKILPDNLELKQWQYEAPHDTVMVANKIMALLKKRGQI